MGTAALVGTALTYSYQHGWRWPALLLVALLTVVPASELTMQVLQRLIARLIPPRRLPRLDLARIPDLACTMVIVPTMLDSIERAQDLVAHLEVQALGNLDPNIHFALLTDLRDADSPEPSAAGRPRCSRAARGLASAALNAKYAGQAIRDRFFLLPPRTGVGNPQRATCGWVGSASAARLMDLNQAAARRAPIPASHGDGRRPVDPCRNAFASCITLDSGHASCRADRPLGN